MPTDSVQDYLKAIYVLQSAGDDVTTSKIAARLHVAAPSVSSMVKKLVTEGLARHTPYREVRLTPEGESAALQVVRRHRLVETFLHQALGLPWDEVHAEAEVLEHCISSRVEDHMDRVLGHPTRDPHGDPIPPKRGRHREIRDLPLAKVTAGSRVRVERVSDGDPAILRHLAVLKVIPGTEMVVQELSPFGGPLWIRAGSRRHALGAEVVDAIFVSVLGDE